MQTGILRQAVARKRDGAALSSELWEAVVSAYTRGEADEAQVAALLMAATIRGLDETETVALTRAMVASGDTLRYDCGPVIDKHSSGGVGDTTSLLAVPLAAAGGARVAKLAGRALGHTGGTIDKLEAIPGVRTDLAPEAFVALVERIGCAIAAQSARLVPADKKIYALRDRTASVPSVGLIAASIVSKKIAAGADAIVYDVKCGAGAFMRDVIQARELGARILAVTRAFGRRGHVFITDMEQPLGRFAGDGLEVIEARDILRGTETATTPLAELSRRLAQTMLTLAGVAAAPSFDGGRAYGKWIELLEGLGGTRAALEALTPRPAGLRLRADRTGWVKRVDPVAVGEAARALCAAHGPFAGVEVHVRTGTKVTAGDPVLTVYGGDPAPELIQAVTIGEDATAERLLVLAELHD